MKAIPSIINSDIRKSEVKNPFLNIIEKNNKLIEQSLQNQNKVMS